MSAMFDYITGKKSGRKAELEASLEHMGGHLGIEIEDNEKLRAELAHIHKDRTAWANVELSEENDRLIAENERLRKIETAARALKFSAYPAHGSGFVLQVHGGNINDLEAALGTADEQNALEK